MIFLDPNVISETLRKVPNPAVIEWLVQHDAELALPTVTIAEIADAIAKIRPDEQADRLAEGLVAHRDFEIDVMMEVAAKVFGPPLHRQVTAFNLQQTLTGSPDKTVSSTRKARRRTSSIRPAEQFAPPRITGEAQSRSGAPSGKNGRK